jgi:flagellar motor component MotA
MTTQAAFTEEEWTLILEGPSGAGFTVIMAQRGGTIRETVSMAKAYVEAQQQPGNSELIDAIVAHKPKADRSHSHSFEELRDRTLEHLRNAVALLDAKAAPEEVADYKKFVVDVATHAARAHTEKGNDEPISEAEQAALTAITEALA